MSDDGDFSWLGLHAENTILGKLFATVVTLVIGVLLGILWMAVYFDGMQWEPPWRSVVRVLLNSFLMFWATGLIYIWWRPRWLRIVYHRAERIVVIVAYVCVYAGMAYLAIAAVFVVMQQLK